ncbi:peptide ABC transporter substrate-binding protein [Maledivibacter halophilus]|uniref:Oligopeptide transport system substrate-binding protein n=1 Tax=Maledivibacter halophilus TaxID=36842 RepID=A0A1T5MWZ1_9FIRM|nr:peptide ABC transporter substrate-binding protein [Maledivibacter halophilus]SKC92513.1 oligopeptide transport system substrate-binding protein [Maledivibacter halophilus]
MMKKVLSILLVLVLAVSLFTGCGQNTANDTEEPNTNNEEEKDNIGAEEEKEEVPQVFTYNMGADPETLDPNRASENVGLTVLGNTFEGLVRLDDNSKAEPGMAEKWDINEDATEFTFYLRDDAKWSDGKPVTAHDFKYSWVRALKPETASDYAYQLYYIKNAEKFFNGEATEEDLGIEVIDDKTIKVNLEGPTGWMEQIFAFQTLFPVRKDIVEADPEGWALKPETLISNGPFKIVEWSHNEMIKMVPNEHYWNREAVKLDEFNMTLINENSTALAAYESGQLDAIDDVPRSEIPRLQSEEEGFMILPDISTFYFTFNNEVEPLNDEKVRKALSYSIDRRAIVDTVLQGGETPATGIVPYGINYGGEDFREVGGNYGIDPEGAKVEEARKLLEEAGYPNGEGFPTLTISYNTDENNKKLAETIQEMWNKNLNISVELSNQEWKVHLIKLESYDYEIGRISWGADYVHPMTFIDLFLSDSGNNYTGWGSEEYDNLVRLAKSETDSKKVNEYMHKAEDILMERMAIMPIYYRTNPEAIKPYVKDWVINPLGNLFADKIYIEK